MDVLKNYLSANDVISPEKQRQIHLSSVGMDTYDLICTLAAPAVLESKTFAQLVEVVQRHVKPPPIKIVACFKFYTLARMEGNQFQIL